MENDPFLCEFCIADNALRLEIQERGGHVETCPVCGQDGGRALPAADSRVTRIVRALIRLHFSEWDYNTHLGGGSLQFLVFDSKAIFDFGIKSNALEFEQVFLVIEGAVGWYPDAEEDIALGGGYWGGGVLNGVRERRDSRVEDLVAEALERNYFEIEGVTRDLVRALQSDIAQVVPSGAEFVRGRVGVQARLKKIDDVLLRPVFGYLPYTGTSIDCPPLSVATEGRFNRARVSVLYLASDECTAVAELRPHPGHLVSTAKFRLKRDIKVANFASQDIRCFLSDSRLEDLRTILSIADVLNVPVQPEHKSLYTITQLFSDALRAEGYDGLSYKSSVGAGYNLTCFISDEFEMVEGSEGLKEVKALNYDFKTVPVEPQDYDKKQFMKDEDSPLATLLHGMARRR